MDYLVQFDTTRWQNHADVNVAASFYQLALKKNYSCGLETCIY